MFLSELRIVIAGNYIVQSILELKLE